jgi:hypothetical protein
MKIEIIVGTGDDYFRHPDTGLVDMPTVALNLHEVARQIADGRREGGLRDGNGNRNIAFRVIEESAS